jgi:hypothetical protein
LSTTIKASFIEACPEETEDVKNMTMLTGYGFKINQKYKAFDNNGCSIPPTIDVGYQKLYMTVDGEISDANARITSFNDEVCSNNFYTGFLIWY